MNSREFLVEYVRFDPEKLKGKLNAEFKGLNQDNKEWKLNQARLKFWTIPGDNRFPKWLEQFDPSKQKKKYVNWMITRYLDGGIKVLEDFGSGIVQALERFEDLKNKKKLGDDADINKLKGLSDLNELIRSHDKTSLDYDAKEVDVILDSNNYSIISPKTYNASKALACNTDWCTAFPDMYEDYSKDGPLYVIRDKKTDELWQFHFESSSFMNARDEPIDNKEFSGDETQGLMPFLFARPELAKAFASIGKLKIEDDSMIMVSDDGVRQTQYAYDKTGVLHRDPDKGPAGYIKRNGRESKIKSSSGLANLARFSTQAAIETELSLYYIHGAKHRDNGPAEISRQGDFTIEHWYQNGKLHRDPEEGPAKTTYLDTETGEIDPSSLDLGDPEEALQRYERRYEYWVNGEEVRDPTKVKEDAQYDNELAEMLSIAGISPHQLEMRNTIEKNSKTAAEKSKFQAENKVQPGTDEWFRLWFARPDLTGETPFD